MKPVEASNKMSDALDMDIGQAGQGRREMLDKNAYNVYTWHLCTRVGDCNQLAACMSACMS